MSDKNEGQNKECCEPLKKGVWNLWVTIVLSIIIACLITCCIVFVYSDYPRKLETVEHVINSQTQFCCRSRCCSCCCHSCCGLPKDDPFTDLSENKNVTKNSSAAFITFIICASCVLAIAIVCVAMLAINANKSELTRKKLYAMYSTYKEIKISDLDSELKIDEETQKQKEKTNEKVKIEANGRVYE